MQVDNTLILNLENLARLELAPEERELLRGGLNHILNMIEQLNALDTTDVEPLIYVNDEVNNLRPDEVRHQISRADALKNAPLQDGTFFKVPKVLDI
jgi:aspartyl-tRNA(Asn)/glutamyl-tRNA(Gln) amidotransferase subunit C